MTWVRFLLVLTREMSSAFPFFMVLVCRVAGELEQLILQKTGRGDLKGKGLLCVSFLYFLTFAQPLMLNQHWVWGG